MTVRASWAAIAVAAGLAASADAAAAQTLRVRAGEHPAYSRVVIDARPGAAFDWSVSGRTLRATVSGAAQFDVTGASSRGLGRISGFSAAGGALEIALSCECGARVSRLGDGRIVIDVAEGAPRPAAQPAAAAAAASAPATPAARPAARPAVAAAQAGDVAPPAVDAGAVSPDEVSDDGQPSMTADTAATPAPPSAEPAREVSGAIAAGEPPADSPSTVAAPQESAQVAAPPEAAEPEPAPAAPSLPGDAASRIEAARQALLQQLARAADEGFLELSDRADPSAIARETSAPVDTDLPEPNLRARTALDIARDRDARLPRREPARPDNCLPAAEFALADWADDRPMDEQLAPLRRAMVGEFDRPDPEAVLAYARLMTHFGFGAEARAALDAFRSGVTAPASLSELAFIVDGETPPEDGVLRRGIDCPGPHALWAASAAASASALDPADIRLDDLISQIGRVPERLRAAVVAPIARTALDAGDVGGAERLSAVVTRGVDDLATIDPMMAVLLARIQAARGRHAVAEDALTALAQRTSPAGVEAMIELVSQRLARGLPAPEGLADNMEAVAFALGDSDLGRRLLVAAARARAATEGLAPALESLAVLAERAGDDAAAGAAAREFLIDHVPDTAHGVEYARAVLTHLALIGDGPEADAARVAVARNFASVGVENLGEALLAPALRRGDIDARLAASDAALAAGAPERALDHLDGLIRPDAAKLRALAYAALGRAPEAARAARESGDAEFAATMAWRAGDWAGAAKAGDADRRIVAAWMSGAESLPDDLRAAADESPELGVLAKALPEEGAAEAETVVGEAEAALAASRRRREAMGGLLTDG
ncbi:hypothetical protein [Rubrimonas cliftonensis]|uniref:Uncharacterized protein n=1 Tax=Rubrimonas cliftonensis TaxID=89524 RepID=A0A1H4C7L1_9RHOB|nr:hypothetical protein [Rubrimonas cliftonensis]SEA56072.1 hypothetical protein SAMN05444370_106235 [Rubrimonas cliftonensis]